MAHRTDPERTLRRVLSVAGSDSGGGAGVQADLKTFEAFGVYGMTAITAVTAQNTTGVQSVEGVSPEMVRAQMKSVLWDIGADAIKTGMLLSCDTICAVADTIEEYDRVRHVPLVVDPVMQAKSGDRLLSDGAQAVLKARLAPLTTILTPNVPEAEQLLGEHIRIESMDSMRLTVSQLLEELPETRAVLLKGGHFESADNLCVDIFCDRLHGGLVEFALPRLNTKNTHGTGCTTAAAIAAGLAKGYTPLEAVRVAKNYVHGCIRCSLSLGRGHGPLFHAHARFEVGIRDSALYPDINEVSQVSI